MTMSAEPFDIAAALSKEASDENLWKLKPTPSRRKLRVFVRTGSHTSFVGHSTKLLCFSGVCKHQRSSVHVTMAARAPLCRQEGRLQVYFGKNANRWSFTCLVCVCHHDTRVPTEDTTSLQPSPSLQLSWE